MADVNIGTSLIVSKGGLSQTIYTSNVTANMSQAGLRTTVYTLSTNASSISTANLSAVGVAHIQNIATDTNATALVSVVSGANTIAFASLRPGEPAMLRLAQNVSFQATGHTAALLRVDITEG